jgi:hypothetical protein
MARQIEVMQEERLYKVQPQNCTGTDRFAKELELLEDKKDRAQLELSLYSQAMDVFRPHLRCMYIMLCCIRAWKY